jgi:hypothetical protein
MTKTPLVLYHRDQDGACAAWCVLQHYPDAECVSVQYREGPPPHELAEGRDVWVVDFSWPAEELQTLAEAAESLTVIDHHKTASEALRDFIGAHSPPLGKPTGTWWRWGTAGTGRSVFFDLARSGAGLTWDVLNPGEPRPWFVDYVEDAALGRWELPDSKAVSAYLGTLEGGPRRFNEIPPVPLTDERGRRLDISIVVGAGEAILRYQARLVRGICEQARMELLPEMPPHPDCPMCDGSGTHREEHEAWAIETMLCMCVWPPHTAPVPTVHSHVLASEIGNALASEPGVPFAVVVSEGPEETRYELRSVPCVRCHGKGNAGEAAPHIICGTCNGTGGVDVSEIAKPYGGGGHKHAAGFVVLK